MSNLLNILQNENLVLEFSSWSRMDNWQLKVFKNISQQWEKISNIISSVTEEVQVDHNF